MHPPSIRPRSAQRQRVCIDIGTSLMGPRHFGKGFYLGNGLVLPWFGKYAVAVVENPTDHRQPVSA
jgi:hypothetical protein